MSYNLRIGEFESQSNPEERSVRADVRYETLPEAPVNSSDTRSNTCYPGYCQWHEFTKSAGLEDVFYGTEANKYSWFHQGVEQETILQNHPGVVELTKAMLERFQLALAIFQEQEPQATDAYEYDEKRLNWLVWWSEWALKNCTYPSFGNS